MIESPTDTVQRPDRLAAAMERVLAQQGRRRQGMPKPQVLVTAPGFTFASGDRRRRFHAASVGKMMAATLVFQLAERGELDVDAPVARLLPREEWHGLFLGDDATVMHLLTHTSGAADYFGGRSSALTPFVKRIAGEPDRLWTPAALLDESRRWQHPVGAPGERFFYSDTGYVLLGRVIEEVGGASLGTQLHERIFAPVGMDDSCLLFHTMPGGAESPDNPGAALDLAPIWLGDAELSRARSLSCDWGGGGVVSTVDDLVRFSIAWHGGELLGETSRDRMRDVRRRMRPGIHYGAGLMQLRYGGFFPLLAGMPRTVGHSGITGTHLFASPERGIHLALNFHATSQNIPSFRAHVALLRLVLRALES